MSYIKYDRSMAETFQESLSTQVENINIVLNNIENFCNKSVNKIDYDTQICVEHVSSRTRVDAAGNEDLVSSVNYSPDYRTEWADFIRCTDDIKKECSTIKNGVLSKLTKLVDAVKNINLLINEFDKGENFTLVDAFADNKNIKVVVDEETKEELIFFVDEDGNQISMSDLLNSMYTYSGITMDAMVEAAIKAEEGGYEFSTGMQNEILNNVNSLVGEVKGSGLLGVVSEEDILAVDAKLSGDETYESILTKSNGDGTATGSVSSAGTNVGKDALKAYVLSDIPENPEDYKYSEVIDSQLGEEVEGEGTVDVDIPQSSDGGSNDIPSKESEPPANGEGLGDMPNEELHSGDGGSVERNPMDDESSLRGDEGYTSPSDYRFDVKPEDFGRPSKIEEIKTEIHDNYDDLAREKFEALGEETIAERRQEIISKADELYQMEDKTQLREQLSKYGYEVDEIEQIIKDPNATVSAMVEGDQRSQMAEYAREFANADGVKNFDTVYDDGQSYEDYTNGNSSSLLANMSEDVNVQKAKEDYLENRLLYKMVSDDVSTSVDNVNDALERIEKIKASNSLSYSEWSQDTIDDYNAAVKQYNESMDAYTSKLETLKVAEAKYEAAYDSYNQAKESFIKQYNPNYEMPNNDDKLSNITVKSYTHVSEGINGIPGPVPKVEDNLSVEVNVDVGNVSSEAISGVVIGTDGKPITGVPVNQNSKPLVDGLYNDSRFSDKLLEKLTISKSDYDIPLPTPVKPKMEILTDSGSADVNVGKIMNSSYNEDMPIISNEEFVNLPAGTVVNDNGGFENTDVNNDQPILIQPEIKKDFAGKDEPDIPELIQPELKKTFGVRLKAEQK